MAKQSFRDLIKERSLYLKGANRTYMWLDLNNDLPVEVLKEEGYEPGSLDAISTWLQEVGFENLSFLRNGNNVIIVAPDDNKNFVIRILSEYRDKRHIPHLFQPFYVKKIGGFVIEFSPTVSQHYSNEEFRQALGVYTREVEQSGYNPRYRDFGLFPFSYEVTKPWKMTKTVPMSYDQDDVDNGYDGVSRSRCTEDYPPLDVQHKLHKQIVSRDARLQKMIGGILEPLPETEIIFSSGLSKWVHQHFIKPTPKGGGRSQS